MTRVPPGHPEGYLEGFANIYAEAARAILARRDGAAVDAASRGHSVVLVEQSARIAKSLQAAAALLNEPGVHVVCADALAYLAKPRTSSALLDLVFLDPPYGQGWLDRIIMPLLPHLADGARLYIESEQPLSEIPAPGLACLRQGKAGQVHYHLYEFEPTHEPTNEPTT